MKLFKCMSVIFAFVFTPICFSSEINNCFKIGSQWHDFILPNNMKNIRWLFGDDKHQTPFMSVSFNIDDIDFDVWAKNCNVKMEKLGRDYVYIIDIQNNTGGSISVMKYKDNRYCIGVERTNVPDVSKNVNGKPYLGCPIDGPIDY